MSKNVYTWFVHVSILLKKCLHFLVRVSTLSKNVYSYLDKYSSKVYEWTVWGVNTLSPLRSIYLFSQFSDTDMQSKSKIGLRSTFSELYYKTNKSTRESGQYGWIDLGLGYKKRWKEFFSKSHCPLCSFRQVYKKGRIVECVRKYRFLCHSHPNRNPYNLIICYLHNIIVAPPYIRLVEWSKLYFIITFAELQTNFSISTHFIWKYDSTKKCK